MILYLGMSDVFLAHTHQGLRVEARRHTTEVDLRVDVYARQNETGTAINQNHFARTFSPLKVHDHVVTGVESHCAYLAVEG